MQMRKTNHSYKSNKSNYKKKFDSTALQEDQEVGYEVMANEEEEQLIE